MHVVSINTKLASTHLLLRLCHTANVSWKQFLEQRTAKEDITVMPSSQKPAKPPLATGLQALFHISHCKNV
jgi:hypothetical protein